AFHTVFVGAKRSAGASPPPSQAATSPAPSPTNPIARPRRSAGPHPARRKPHAVGPPRSSRRQPSASATTSEIWNTRFRMAENLNGKPGALDTLAITGLATLATTTSAIRRPTSCADLTRRGAGGRRSRQGLPVALLVLLPAAARARIVAPDLLAVAL